MKRGLNRRGYFFVVDAVIASAILFVGLIALFGSGVRSEDSVQPLATVEDLLATFATQPVSATLNQYYTDTLLPAGLVPYPEATPLEQIVYLNYTNCAPIDCDSHAQNYTLNLLTAALGDDYGASVIINGTTIATKPHAQRYLLVRGFVVYARLNDTTVIGPLAAEVRLWS